MPLLSPRQVKPLIWIESVIEKHSHSRIEYMIKVSVCPVDSVSLGDGTILLLRVLLCLWPVQGLWHKVLTQG